MDLFVCWFRHGTHKQQQNKPLMALLDKFMLWPLVMVCYLLEHRCFFSVWRYLLYLYFSCSLHDLHMSCDVHFECLQLCLNFVQDARILVWKFSAAGNVFEPAASLSDHRLAVVSLVAGAMKLYSGSMDNTIKVWTLEQLFSFLM